MNDHLKLFLTYIGFYVAMQIFFIKDSLWDILKMTSMLFFLFVLPGFSILYKKEFLERLVFGFILSLAIVGTLSYYIGLVFLHINMHWMISVIITFIGVRFEYHYKLKKMI